MGPGGQQTGSLYQQVSGRIVRFGHKIRRGNSLENLFVTVMEPIISIPWDHSMFTFMIQGHHPLTKWG